MKERRGEKGIKMKNTKIDQEENDARKKTGNRKCGEEGKRKIEPID